ncbi:MAG: hypothetical protein KAV87_23195 [Desulfobacteraceae bacterium]|nr:hypothetical protein [Desulfobacteraceae bacterium]
MSPRFVIVVSVLLVLVFADRNTASADENNNNQMALPMMSLSGEQPSSENFRADRFGLNSYEAIMEGDLSLCKENKGCLEEAAMIQEWACAADICNAFDDTKNSHDILQTQLRACIDGEVGEDFSEIALSLCALIKSPSSVTRKEFLRHISDPKATEDAMVQIGAYLMALKGSGDECIHYVKGYMGPYGPNWTYKWYRVIAGCRMLSQESSRETLEYNFSYWYDESYCPLISDDELRKACNAAEEVLSFDDQGQ